MQGRLNFVLHKYTSEETEKDSQSGRILRVTVESACK